MSTLYPVGTVLPYAGEMNQNTEAALVAAGYIPCDGRALSISTPQYTALYQAIGDAYGATDKDFYVPDYRGRFLRGTDLGAGVDPDAGTRTAPNPGATKPGNTGDAVGSLQPDQFTAHGHSYTVHHNDHRIDYGGAETPGVFEKSTKQGTSGAAGGAETRPVNANINFVIVYQ